jgi:hypothetical protein
MEATEAQKKYILGLARKSKLYYNTLGDEDLIPNVEHDLKISWANLDKTTASQIIRRMVNTVDKQRYGLYSKWKQ